MDHGSFVSSNKCVVVRSGRGRCYRWGKAEVAPLGLPSHLPPPTRLLTHPSNHLPTRPPTHPPAHLHWRHLVHDAVAWLPSHQDPAHGAHIADAQALGKVAPRLLGRRQVCGGKGGEAGEPKGASREGCKMLGGSQLEELCAGPAGRAVSAAHSAQVNYCSCGSTTLFPAHFAQAALIATH